MSVDPSFVHNAPTSATQPALRVWLVEDDASIRWVLERAALVSRHRARQVRVRGHHDHGQRRVHGAHFAQQVDTGAARHADVGEQHVGRIVAQRGERGLRRFEGARHHAAGAQRAFEHPADRCVVFHEPDS
jgi:hypothetical protein